MAKKYVPSAGDIVWLKFDPQAGHEQKGHRPALVISPLDYNRKTGLMLCCPLTTQIKGYPFEVLMGGNKQSVALADQIKSLDWKARQATLKGVVSNEELSEVRAKAMALIDGQKMQSVKRLIALGATMPEMQDVPRR